MRASTHLGIKHRVLVLVSSDHLACVGLEGRIERHEDGTVFCFGEVL